MTATYHRSARFSGLPDPQAQPEFYRSVPMRRFSAFALDSLLICIITVIAIPLTGFTGLFFLPVLVTVISFIYRFWTLRSGSATWGMRLVGIELRDHRGERLSPGIAAAHVGLYLVFLGTVLPTLISLASMMMTSRRQSLPDLFLGVAAIRTPA